MSTLVMEALVDSRSEEKILSQIVEAMLGVQSELTHCSEDQWDDLLRDACRARKWQAAELEVESC